MAGHEGEQRDEIEQEGNVEQAEEGERGGDDRRAVVFIHDDKADEAPSSEKTSTSSMPKWTSRCGCGWCTRKYQDAKKDERPAKEAAFFKDLVAFVLLRAVKLQCPARPKMAMRMRQAESQP